MYVYKFIYSSLQMHILCLTKFQNIYFYTSTCQQQSQKIFYLSSPRCGTDKYVNIYSGYNKIYNVINKYMNIYSGSLDIY